MRNIQIPPMTNDFKKIEAGAGPKAIFPQKTPKSVPSEEAPMIP